LRHLIGIVALLICAYVAAQDASLVGAWQFNTHELVQQLELNADGSYRRHIVTATNKRTEIGRWRSDVSVLVLSPDHVITAQGANVPLPPREKLIDVAGVDQQTLTLYYDGDVLERWQRRNDNAAPVPVVASSAVKLQAIPQKIAQPVLPLDHITRQRTRSIVIRTAQITLPAPVIDVPELPSFRQEHTVAPPTIPTVDVPVAISITTPVSPEFAIAAESLPPPSHSQPQPKTNVVKQNQTVSSPAGLYDEQQVAELITQLACEQLRYPQRANTPNAPRDRQLAIDAGMTPFDATRLKRTLHYYQSNSAFMQKHQSQIAERSMACVLARQQVSVRN